MSSETKNKPVETIRVGGVSIPIWKNDGDEGAYYKAGTPEIRYKGKDDQWHTGKSYGRNDLRNLVKAACLADSKIIELNRAANANAPDDEPDGE